MANDCIEADFSCEEDLKQLVERLGQLFMGELVDMCTVTDRQTDR